MKMVGFLFSSAKEEKTYILCERFSQDILENYFGTIRMKGGRNSNCSAQEAPLRQSECKVRKLKSLFAGTALDNKKGRSLKKFQTLQIRSVHVSQVKSRFELVILRTVYVII